MPDHAQARPTGRELPGGCRVVRARCAIHQTRQLDDQRNAASARWSLKEGRVLVVDDALTADPAPPAAIVNVYGLRAFMLAPLARKDASGLIGWISVHENSGPRRWTEAEVGAVQAAVERVHAIYFAR